MLFTEVSHALEGVKGWLHPGEQRLLYDLAREVPSGGTIVELGAWMGRSSIVLGGGSLSGPKARVYAVDIFAEKREVNSVVYREHFDEHFSPGESDYLPTFDKNIRGAGVEGVVIPIRGLTAKAGRQWEGPLIDLLFIDANHDYEGVRDDFFAWVPHCKEGAPCAFHDYYNVDYPGVRQFVDQLLAAEILDDIRSADSIICGRLQITDRAQIEERLNRPHPRRPWPASVRSHWYELLVASGWKEVAQKNRRKARTWAIEAIRLNPWRTDAWRLAVTSMLKATNRGS
jgi:hypothetical protein